jgi:hypothetical protein
MVLIAGLILSSFPQERISRSPHQRIKTMENIQAESTNIEIAKSINSQNSSCPANIPSP